MVLLAVRAELYNELRTYREKEFRTFMFGLTLLVLGYLPFATTQLRVLLTLSGLVLCWYLVGNLNRAQRLKRRISEVQEQLGIERLHDGLSTTAWHAKPFYRHLATMSYLGLLLAATAGLWMQ